MTNIKEVIELHITATGKLGDPYGKIDGKVVYLKLKKDEKLRTNRPLVKITYKCDSYAYAELATK